MTNRIQTELGEFIIDSRLSAVIEHGLYSLEDLQLGEGGDDGACAVHHPAGEGHLAQRHEMIFKRKIGHSVGDQKSFDAAHESIETSRLAADVPKDAGHDQLITPKYHEPVVQLGLKEGAITVLFDDVVALDRDQTKGKARKFRSTHDTRFLEIPQQAALAAILLARLGRKEDRDLEA
jgi:hypothetical protein